MLSSGILCAESTPVLQLPYSQLVVRNDRQTSFSLSVLEDKGKIKMELKNFIFKGMAPFDGLVYLDEERINIAYLVSPKLKVHGFIKTDTDQVDLTLLFKDISVREIVKIFDVQGEALNSFDSHFSGKMHIWGDRNSPYVSIESTSGEGYFFDIPFVYAQMNLEGQYPFLFFAESFIQKSNSNTIDISGILDVRDVDTSFEEMKFTQDRLEVGELEVTSEAGKDIVYFKDSAGKYQILLNSAPGDQGSMDFLLQLKKNDYLKIRFKEQDSIVGWEKRIEF